jgi:hypothetical protein
VVVKRADLFLVEAAPGLPPTTPPQRVSARRMNAGSGWRLRSNQYDAVPPLARGQEGVLLGRRKGGGIASRAAVILREPRNPGVGRGPLAVLVG